MSIRSFIGASSALLLAWLGATFLNKVPVESYRQQSRGVSPITGKIAISPEKTVAQNAAVEKP